MGPSYLSSHSVSIILQPHVSVIDKKNVENAISFDVFWYLFSTNSDKILRYDALSSKTRKKYQQK